MSKSIISWRPLHYLGRLPPSWRFLVALATAAGAWLLGPSYLIPVSRWTLAWDAFAVVTLLLLWSAILTADADRIRAVAATENLSRTLSSVFVLVAAGASLAAAEALVTTMHGLGPLATARHVGLSAVAVVSSWLLVHTVFTIRYARIYYDQDADGRDVGGLDFPGHLHEPDFLDLAYFAFTIGMAAQTADVTISHRRQRRVALLHSLISFVFNTTLLALIISGAASSL